MKEITLKSAIKQERTRRQNLKFKRQAMAIVQKEACQAGEHSLNIEYLVGSANHSVENQIFGRPITSWGCEYCEFIEPPKTKGLLEVLLYDEPQKTGRTL
jgi:hypothetical protein